MADTATSSQVDQFIVGINTRGQTEEEALFTYYQMLHHPEMKLLLDRYTPSILSAIQRKDIQELNSILEKVRSDFFLSFSEKPVQVRTSEQKRVEELFVSEKTNDLARARAATTALGSASTAAEGAYTKRRDFIEKLVTAYSKKPPQEMVEKIVAVAETQKNASVSELMQEVTKQAGVEPDAVRSLQKDERFVRVVKEIQQSSIVGNEQVFIQTILESHYPAETAAIMTKRVTHMTPTDTFQGVVQDIKVVSAAQAMMSAASDSTPDYRNFFRDLAQYGGVAEKIMAPIADAVLSVVPKQTRENIALGVMSSLWKKETRDGGPVQIALGALFESEAISRLLQKWNTDVFATTRPISNQEFEFAKDVARTVFSGGPRVAKPSPIGDAITTVFHPKGLSQVWIDIVRVDATLLPATAGQYYLSLSAKQLVSSRVQMMGYDFWSFLAKRGIVQKTTGAAAGKLGKTAVREVGGKIATSTIGKSLGAFFGSFLGPGIGTFLGWLVGDVVIDQGLKLIGRAVSGLFNLLSLKSVVDLFSGDLPTTPLWQQEGAKWLIIGAGVLLFITLFPLSLVGLTGTSYQKLVDDNTFVQGLGSSDTGRPGGPTLDCLGADKDKPECDMTPCDPSKQDCRWPTIGLVVQGPQTTGPNGVCPGTHTGAQAIDIDPIGGNIPSVYATIAGTVTDAHFGCPTDTGCGDGSCTCANYVVITGTSYSVGYWHLANTQMVQTGQAVSVGDVVGIMDHTGHSTGTHLHYEYWGPGGISSILPTAVPTCNNFSTASCPCPNIITGVAP